MARPPIWRKNGNGGKGLSPMQCGAAGSRASWPAAHRHKPASTVAVNAGGEYAVLDQIKVFVAGRVEKIFLGRGDEDLDNNDGSLIGTFLDSVGAKLGSAGISAGVKGES